MKGAHPWPPNKLFVATIFESVASLLCCLLCVRNVKKQQRNLCRNNCKVTNINEKKKLLLRRGDPMFDSEILLGISQCKGKPGFFSWRVVGGGGILKRLHSADQTAQLRYY